MNCPSYLPFTGAHVVDLADSVNKTTLLEGMIMSATGKTIYTNINTTTSTIKISDKLNDKTVLGVYAGTYTYTSNASILEYIVNSLGDGGILVSNYSGEIQNGDYITTCPIAGYGTLQADDIMHSYTVAKCTQTIDWSSVAENITLDGVKYKSVMTTCTYHCG